MKTIRVTLTLVKTYPLVDVQNWYPKNADGTPIAENELIANLTQEYQKEIDPVEAINDDENWTKVQVEVVNETT